MIRRLMELYEEIRPQIENLRRTAQEAGCRIGAMDELVDTSNEQPLPTKETP